MTKISKILFAFLITGFPFTLSSQEIVNSLEGNPVAEKYYSQPYPVKKGLLAADTLELPFIDDFSDSYVEPRTDLWADNFAFINSTYAIYPPSVGVATLDALDFEGSHYPGAGSFPYQADYLTSHPINLAFLPADNLYLSFFYQPGGLAEPPETGDSLLLDFYAPLTETWVNIWSVPGIYSPDTFFRAMIPINQPEFLQKGFRFRFRNYASQLAIPDQYDKRVNVDLWHIDYVKLDKNRQASDTVLRDVTFIEPVKGILKDYFSIPWPHFEDAFVTQRAAFIGVVIENHDTISRNVGTVLEIRDLYQSKPVYKVPAFNNDIEAGDSIFYKYSYNYPFDFEPVDSAAFEIKAYIQTDLFDYKPNDTLIHIQKFYDYYALDDGTAEASYGLRGSGTKDVSSALKFNFFTKDSLRAIDIYFPKVLESLNREYYFYLNVWTDNGGKPGEKIADQIGMRPGYSDTINKFVRYYLETPLLITGNYYIGFTQTVEKLLNVGLDLNKENKARIFNNFDNGIWKNTTTLPGTPMMRPVFRMNDFPGLVQPAENLLFSAYPNPADSYIRISMNGVTGSGNRSPVIELIDISGRVVRTMNLSQDDLLETSDLHNGMYFLRLSDPRVKKSSSIKIIINH